MTGTSTRQHQSTSPVAPDGWKSALARVGAVGGLLFVATVAVGFLIKNVLSSTPVGRMDRRLSEWFESVRTPRWNDLTDWGSAFSDTITIVILLAVALPLLYLLVRRWNEPLLLLFAVGFETLIFVAAGAVVGRDRPPVEQLDVSPPTASFPSGHTGAAVAFYIGVLVLVFWWVRNKAARGVAVAVLGAIPVIVALSRLYRGMHYLTDVTWGAVVGAVSVALFAWILRPEQAGDRR